MDEFDLLKKRFVLRDTFDYDIHFGLYVEANAPLDMRTLAFNHAIQDLKRVLIEKCAVSYIKLSDGNAHISLSECIEEMRENPFDILRKAFRYYCRIVIPICLYAKKAEILNKAEEIMIKTRTLITLDVSHDICIYINGNLDESLRARGNVISMLELLHGRQVTIKQGYLSLDEVLKLGYRVFYSTKINTNKAYLTSHKSNPVNLELLEPGREHLKEFVYFDTLKFNYILYYRRLNIENVLCVNDCYLEIEDGYGRKTCVSIIGFCKYKQRKCKAQLLNLLEDTIKVLIDVYDHRLKALQLFVFNDTKINYDKYKNRKYLVVGSMVEVKKFLTDKKNICEVEIDLDPELEDFLCGKKNGKINKIVKDTECEVTVKTRLTEIEREMVVFIQGVGENIKIAIDMLENEFPAELCFFLHERHHKRIIGVGGKNIQKIMKRHGVYIKFMGEKERQISGYKGNVIIKTPKKNESALQKMKGEVLTLADERVTEKAIPYVPLNLLDFYDFTFEQCKIYYDTAVVRANLNIPIKTYLVSADFLYTLKNDENRVIIRCANSQSIFIKTFEDLDATRIDGSYWYDKDPKVTFKMFDSVLFYSYESMFGEEMRDKNDVMRIEFSERSPRHPPLMDDFTVGNKRRTDENHMK